MLKPSEQLSKMIQIVSTAFERDLDKGGTPYILHCLHVMNIVGKKTDNDFECMTIAVGHDLLEDHPNFWGDVLSEGFSNRVIDGITIMTHNVDEPYMEYIERVAKNPDTRLIKMVDIKHNSDPHRLPEVSDKSFNRIVKYHKAYSYLKSFK